MRQAGADGVAVYSGHQWMVVRPQPGSLEALIGLFADCDLVLLEGPKASPYPKIELVRGAVSHESVCAPETLLALATDTPARVDGVETIGDVYKRQHEGRAGLGVNGHGLHALPGQQAEGDFVQPGARRDQAFPRGDVLPRKADVGPGFHRKMCIRDSWLEAQLQP